VKLNSRLAINLVVVAILGVVTVGWVLTQIVGTGAFESPMSISADFESSGGVFTNQEVTYRGVLVGRVGALELNDDGVDIELLIDPEWADKIPTAVEAKVQSKSAVGEQFVNLTPMAGAGDDEVLESGDEIARANTNLPVDFQELLASLDRVLGDVSPRRTQRVIENLAGGLGGREKDIATILESLGKISDAFADVAPEQRSLLRNSTTAGTEFLRTKDEFAAAIRAADQVLAGIGDEPEELSRLLSANDRLARAVLGLLARHSDNLAGGIGALSDFVSFQLDNKEELIVKSLDHIPDILHAVEDASIPWRSPDGKEFYRLRIGLVYENIRSSWPCKYRLPEEWERFPHERERRIPKVNSKCRPRGGEAETADSLVNALQAWAKSNPEDLVVVAERINGLQVSDAGFVWPLDGQVTSFFAPRDGRMHTGLDIDGEMGDPFIASAAGTVVLAEPYYGYGKTIVIDHGNSLTTLYGHSSALLVETGDFVEQGDVIGLVGCTGSCTGPHLHFEIRVDGVPVNPLPLLPGPQTVPWKHPDPGLGSLAGPR
jgi:virulence factor Mce-like protein